MTMGRVSRRQTAIRHSSGKLHLFTIVECLDGRAAKPGEHGSQRAQGRAAGIFGMQLEQRRLCTLMENRCCAWTGAGCLKASTGALRYWTSCRMTNGTNTCVPVGLHMNIRALWPCCLINRQMQSGGCTPRSATREASVRLLVDGNYKTTA